MTAPIAAPIRPLYQHLPLDGLFWLIGGGVAYTFGVIFYVAKARYTHFVWHLFTIAGTPATSLLSCGM